MVKYVDSGLEDTSGNDGVFGASKYGNYAFSSLGSNIDNSNSDSHGNSGGGGGGINSKKNKSIKKGFKVDRRANFERMMARKSGADSSGGSNAKNNKQLNGSSSSAHTRVKSITFNEQDRREYLLSLHKKKNERRVQAFVDAKRKLRKENAKTRREQREEARRAYNNYARIPILPNYTYRLPAYTEGAGSDEDDDDENNEENNSSNDADNDLVEKEDKTVLDDDNKKCKKQKRKSEREAILSSSTHEMPWAMMHSSADNNVEEVVEEISKSNNNNRADNDTINNDERDIGGGGCKRAKVNRSSEVITVEVKPLFTNKYASREQSNVPDKSGSLHSRASSKESVAKKSNTMTSYSLPNNDFSDLPSIVEEELRKLRQATKGPARTPARVKMLKELEKIRKIKKHSRKGHGKRSSSGKRKNRRK